MTSKLHHSVPVGGVHLHCTSMEHPSENRIRPTPENKPNHKCNTYFSESASWTQNPVLKFEEMRASLFDIHLKTDHNPPSGPVLVSKVHRSKSNSKRKTHKPNSGSQAKKERKHQTPSRQHQGQVRLHHTFPSLQPITYNHPGNPTGASGGNPDPVRIPAPDSRFIKPTSWHYPNQILELWNSDQTRPQGQIKSQFPRTIRPTTTNQGSLAHVTQTTTKSAPRRRLHEFRRKT